MKLHLPPPFLAALLTAFCSVSSVTLAAPETVTDANGYKTATYSDKEVTNNIDVSVYTANDTIVFQLPKNQEGNYFANEDISTAASVIIGIPDSAEINDSTGLIISNGWGKSVEFSGKVTGAGTIYRTGKGDDSAIIFSGDVTDYTGNIHIGTNSNVDFTLTFGGKTNAVQATATTATQGVAGTGDITFGSATSKLVFNYSAAETPVYITNAISEIGTVSGSTLTLKGGASYVFTKTIAVDNIALVEGSKILVKYADVNKAFTTSVTDKGVIEFAASSDWKDDSTLGTNDNFAGKLYVTEGKYTFSNVGQNMTLALASGTHMQIVATDKVLKGALVLEGEQHEVHFNGSNVMTLTGSVTGGTFIKLGGGTFNVDGAASVSTLQASNGTTNIKDTAVVSNLTLETYGGKTGTVNLQGGATVTTASVSSGNFNISGGSVSTLTVNGGSVTVSSFDALKSATVSYGQNVGQKSLVLGGEVSLASSGSISLTTAYRRDGSFALNGSGWAHDENKRVLIVEKDTGLDISGALSIVSRAELLVDGGSVTAGSIILGHTDNGAYQGYLAMSSGSLTSGTITLNNTHSNSIDITGGTVEFTTDTALSRGSNTASTINITGTSADAPVVLKATQAAWTLDGSGLTAAPTMGNIKVDADNTHAITLKNVSLSGSVVGNGKFTLGGAIASDDAVLDGALTLDNVTFSGDKVTLQEDARATVANMSDISSLLPQLTGTGTLVLTQNAFIAGAAKSTNTTTVYDFAGNIEVTGGVLQLGDNAGSGTSAMNQLEMKSATIKLNGGGLRYFGGDSTLGHIDVEALATLDVYATNNGSTAQGTLTIEELDVAADKMLTISGQWERNVDIEALTGDGALQIEKPTSKADSDSVVNIDSISFGALKAKGGYINIQAGEHTLKTLDIAINKSSTASVTLKEKAELAIGDGGLWMYNQTSLKLEKEASLTHGVINIKGLSSTEDGRASIKTSVTNAEGQPNGQYSITRADYTISNAEVTVTSDANQTLANKLSDSQIVNAGGGELKLTHADNVLTGIKAMAGDISFELLKDQTLESLYIAEGKTVNVGEATLSIQEAATTNGSKVTNVTFGNGAKLQGNLVLQSGASVSLGTEVQIDGTLTLGYGMELTGAQLEAIENLKNNADERVALFSNVDALKLADAATFSTNSAAGDYTGAQDLSNFFSNVDNGVYLLEFDQNVVYATLIPEPATTTLSLLALAALAARRRRR